MARTKSIDRDRILDAVEGVIAERGAPALTLDLVAERAAISKGGLTYTFATKEEMLSALLDRDISRCRSGLDAAAVRRRPTPYPELVALIDACRDGRCPSRSKTSNMLAAMIHAPASIEPSRTMYKRMINRFPSDKPGDRRARVAFMAMQGMLMMQGMGLIELPPKMRRNLCDDLVRLVTRDSI
jgi:AcrR family transcriptional regulator